MVTLACWVSLGTTYDLDCPFILRGYQPFGWMGAALPPTCVSHAPVGSRKSDDVSRKEEGMPVHPDVGIDTAFQVRVVGDLFPAPYILQSKRQFIISWVTRPSSAAVNFFSMSSKYPLSSERRSGWSPMAKDNSMLLLNPPVVKLAEPTIAWS